MRRRASGPGIMAGALAGLTALAGGCGDLPVAADGPTPVELRIVAPTHLPMYDTATVAVEVIDPDGRVVLDAPVELETPDAYHITLVGAEAASGQIIGRYPGPARLTAKLKPGRFVAEKVASVTTVYWESPTIAFLGVGTDTTMASFGDVSFELAAADYRGRPLSPIAWEGWTLRAVGDPVAESGWHVTRTAPARVAATVVREGFVRLELGHGACGGAACGDTLWIRMIQRGAELVARDLVLTAIGAEAPLEAQALDAGGSPLSHQPFVHWRLEDPADSAIIAIVGRRAVARAVGEARVVAWAGELVDTATVRVAPVWTELALEAPAIIDALGRADTIRVVGRDANGHAVSSPAATVTWSVDDATLLALEPLGQAAVITALDMGRVHVQAAGRECDSCAALEVRRAIDITPPVDSFRVSGERDRLNYLGAVTRLSARVFVNGEPLELNAVEWTALDPGVAAVDSGGTVTAMAEGDARFEGVIGSYVDTATITVRQVVSSVVIGSGPALVVGAMDTLTTNAVDSAGHPVTGRAVTWGSAAPTVAAVDGAGVVTATGEGATTVTATIDPVTATRRVLAFGPGYTLGHGQQTLCVISEGGVPYCGTETLLLQPMEGVVALSAGGSSLCGLVAGDGWRCMGENGSGQLGVGDRIDRVAPTPLDAAQAFTTVEIVGYERYHMAYARPHSCGIAADGQGWCWGDNVGGRLGIADTAAVIPSPRPVDTPLRFRDIAVEEDLTCAAADDGAAYCWGTAFPGQTTPIRPLLVEGSAGLVTVETGRSLACGLTASGTAQCWGDNTYGELGSGASVGRLSAAPVSGDHVFQSLSVGRDHVCGLVTSGRILCWGRNRDLELGDGTYYDRNTPVEAAAGRAFVDVVAVSESTMAKTAGGATWVWGRWGNGASGRWPPSSWTPGFRYVELIRAAP